MGEVMWLPVGATDAKMLAAARHQVHNAAQWLARAAHSYMRPRHERAHTWLRWDAESRALVSQEFLPELALELKPADLTLQFRERSRPAPHIIDLDDRTPAEVEAWVLVELLHRRLDRDRFSKALPYEMPDLMTGDAIPYQRETLEAPLAALSAWLANATAVLTRIAEESFPDGSVWCRPDVFHVVLLPQARTPAAPAEPMLRAGLALGDFDSAEPYFYVTQHQPDAVAGAHPTATLSGAALSSTGDPASHALAFLREAIAARQRRAER